MFNKFVALKNLDSKKALQKHLSVRRLLKEMKDADSRCTGLSYGCGLNEKIGRLLPTAPRALLFPPKNLHF